MLRAYEVEWDVNNYQCFSWDLPQDTPAATYDALTMWGAPMAERWNPPPVFIHRPKKKRGDFWGVGMGGGRLGIAPWALEEVRMFAEMAGELLSLPYKNQTFTVLNITECIECIDPERSESVDYGITRRKRITKPFFRADRMCASTLFKSAHNPLGFYCLEYSRDLEEEFKACVEHQKLTGLQFKEVMIG